MVTWAKPKLFWNNILNSTGSTLTASSTATGYDVANLHNLLETNGWRGTASVDIQYDAGAGNTQSIDFFILDGHNLKDNISTIIVQGSTTGAWAGEEVDIVTVLNANLNATRHLSEFTASTAYRYLRIVTTGTLAAPEITNIVIGLKTELDYATGGFDPYSQNEKSNVNLSMGGIVTGIHTKYTERTLQFTIDDADDTLYQKVKTYRETHGRKNLFIAWETANNPTDVYLMRPTGAFDNPLKLGGAYRTINFSFSGRKA